MLSLSTPPALSRVYAPFVAIALFLAIGAGFLSGIGLALNRLLEEPWASSTTLTSTHRTAQTWGFVGLFVIGMSLRLLPLWTQTTLQLRQLVPVIWLTIAAAVLANALIVPSLASERRDAGEVAVAAALLVASVIFLTMVTTTLNRRSTSARRPPWAFLAGAALLVLAAALRLTVALSDSFLFWIRSAEPLVFLGGFMPAFVVSAAARGFRPGAWGEGRFAVVITIATAAMAALLVYLDAGGQTDVAVRLTGLSVICLAVVWAAVAYLSGVFDAAATRPGTSSWPHLLLVRSAFAWVIIATLIGLWVGGRSFLAAALPDTAGLHAIVHALGMSALILILGMALLLLPEFARTPLRSRSSTLLALLLLVTLNLAAGLRVTTALARESLDGEAVAAAHALAGVLAELALLAFVAAALMAARGLLQGRPRAEEQGD